MTAKRIDGEALAGRIKASLADEIDEVRRRTGTPPRVASILVGSPPGAATYCRSLAKACEAVGIRFDLVGPPAETAAGELAEIIDRLAADPAIHGILLQMPLPEGIPFRDMAERIPPEKDVEGITAASLGRLLFYEKPDLIPTTAAAAYELIRFAGCERQGAECVVVGHSPIVGKPLACLLMNDLATCTVCHIGTRDLKAHTRGAEILVVAVGKAGLVSGDHIRPGATVIDVGINRVPVLGPDGRPVEGPAGRPRMRTVGDVDAASAAEVAGALSPVPGGVGPVTVAMLMRNTVRAARLQLGL